VQVGQRFEVVRVVDEIRDANDTVLDRITGKTLPLRLSSLLFLVKPNLI